MIDDFFKTIDTKLICFQKKNFKVALEYFVHNWENLNAIQISRFKVIWSSPFKKSFREPKYKLELPT